MKKTPILLLCASLLVLVGCARTSTAQGNAQGCASATPAATTSSPPGGPSVGSSSRSSGASSAAVNAPSPVAATYADPQGPPVQATPASSPVKMAEFWLPSGTTVRVRLLETLDTKRNRAGDRFNATLDDPLVSGDRVVVPKGTLFSGHLIRAKSSGRLKGRAVMTLALDSFRLEGRTYRVRSTDSTRVSGRHGKRNSLWIGGGSGGGALVGAAAGGGVGALIGAGVGAAGGTVGAAVTGKKQIRLPAETLVTFRLKSALDVRG